MTAQARMFAKIEAKTTPVLMEMAVALDNDFRDEAEIVLDAILDVLTDRMTEEDFVAFCEKLEHA